MLCFIIYALQCLSGSSDGTIKLWSLGQQRCIATYKIHDEGVWALASDEHLSFFYSSGKDRKVFFTDLTTEYEKTYFLFQEKAPVLSVSDFIVFVGALSSGSGSLKVLGSIPTLADSGYGYRCSSNSNCLICHLGGDGLSKRATLY